MRKYIYLISLVLFIIGIIASIIYAYRYYSLEGKTLCLSKKIERIVPREEYNSCFHSNTQLATVVGGYLKDNPCIISKYRIEYMLVDTKLDLRGGDYNFIMPFINLQSQAPSGYLFKYPLSELLKTRKLPENKIGVKFNEYCDENNLDRELKIYGNKIFPKP